MAISSFPGLGRFAALGSMLAARQNALGAQNQTGPTYMNPQPSGPVTAPVSPQQSTGITPMAGEAPEVPQEPSDITLPPMPVSSMIRDGKPAAPQNSMAGQAHQANQRYRGM